MTPPVSPSDRRLYAEIVESGQKPAEGIANAGSSVFKLDKPGSMYPFMDNARTFRQRDDQIFDFSVMSTSPLRRFFSNSNSFIAEQELRAVHTLPNHRPIHATICCEGSNP